MCVKTNLHSSHVLTMLYMLAWNLMLHSSFSQHVHKSRSVTNAKTRHYPMAQASAKQVCCQLWVISTQDK